MSKRTRNGFTLIEVMIALSLVAIMMAIAYGTASKSMKAKKSYEKTQDRYREVRFAQALIVRDLGMAFLSSNEDRNQMEPRTQFVGASGGDTDSVTFSSMGHTPLYADANESDQTVITYKVEPSKEDRGKDDLIRRETRRLPSLQETVQGTAGQADVLLGGIEKFKLEYWDAKDREWQDSWSTQNTNGDVPRLPDRVKITIVFLDDEDKEIKLVTQARLSITEMLTSYAN